MTLTLTLCRDGAERRLEDSAPPSREGGYVQRRRANRPTTGDGAVTQQRDPTNDEGRRAPRRGAATPGGANDGGRRANEIRDYRGTQAEACGYKGGGEGAGSAEGSGLSAYRWKIFCCRQFIGRVIGFCKDVL
jgi:hypothetical protein